MSDSDDRVVSEVAAEGAALTQDWVLDVVSRACGERNLEGRRVLLIVPDGTRTAPVGAVFKALSKCIGGIVSRMDVLVALGTHRPMTEEEICRRLDITVQERRKDYGNTRFFNHEWDNPDALTQIGVLSRDDIHEISGGLFEMEVPVELNKLVFDYDQLIVIGPVFPHEVVGFSGGNKYFFPGIAGPRILNFFHWLGALITNIGIIGKKDTPVRRVVDTAARLINVDKLCFGLVVNEGKAAGLFAGTPEFAWSEAADLSSELHVKYKDKAFSRIVSCAPEMYDDLWTGAKCMYKLEPVLAEGGELIIYAPHITEISKTHGRLIEEIGYHCRDFFLNRWEEFKHYPWGVLAHSTHLKGAGRFEDGVEIPRAKVTLATGIPEEVCRRINLGYRDYRTINPEEFASKEDEGILLVQRAGEMLYKLSDRPQG
ncbi:MAG: lactate racemase domain-containing protein [Verrucomicrobia bacterium]|nr:lactate racemase domain-containing protein [Verrucomicrobiota bacterium]MCF7707757.1 lactate racemase domain-containing protein [Verrucomicrobiota bacterium]